MNNIDLLMPEFQYKAAKALIEDSKLLGEVKNIIDQNAFQTPLNIIIGCLLDYVKKNGHSPDYTSLQIKLADKAKNNGKSEEYIKELYKVRAASNEGSVAMKEYITNFFRFKYLIATANKILERVQAGDDSELIVKNANKRFNDIFNTYADDCVLTRFTEDTIKEVCMEQDEETIPTGIPRLDEILVGGLGRKEIGLFVAPTGYGKTTFGSILAHNAATIGYKVLQIYFEDKPSDIVRKHIAMETEKNSNRFKKMVENEADVVVKDIEQLDKLGENLITLKMPDGTTTVEDIHNKLIELKSNYDFAPDMIVIDYFSALQHSQNSMKDQNAAQARCMRKIKEMAYEANAAIWVLQQTNRTAVSKDGDSEGMANWQGSFEATQPASVWLTLRRTKEQKANFRADIIINKSRHSQPKEDLLDIKFDNSTLQIDCEDKSNLYEDLMYNDDMAFDPTNGERFKSVINNEVF